MVQGGLDHIPEDQINNLDEIFLSNGIPVVLGEFASTHKDNVEERAKHAKYYAQLAKKYSIPCIWWDNGISEAYKSDAMALLDRRNIEWIYPEIVEALMEGYYSGEDVELPDFSIIFEGVATSKNWGQALAFLTGVDIILDDFKAGDRIAPPSLPPCGSFPYSRTLPHAPKVTATRTRPLFPPRSHRRTFRR